MYPSNPNDYYLRSPPPSAPPPPPPSYGQAQVQSPYDQYVTGVPVQFTPSATWSTGLCDCCSDASNCCLTCLCPCITFGQIAEIVDKGTTSCGVHGPLYTLIAVLTGCGCIYSCIYRSKMRRQYILSESPCNDCLLHCCCELCALCQEYRELKNHGFDMSIGWEGNVERLNRGVVMPPIAQGGMVR